MPYNLLANAKLNRKQTKLLKRKIGLRFLKDVFQIFFDIFFFALALSEMVESSE